MTQSIDFYFDFSSPYGYFGSLFVDTLGVETCWRPYLMGAAMKETGLPPLVEVPYKRDYAILDIERMARLYEVDFSFPDYFPFMSVKLCRAFYAIEAAQGQCAAKAFAAKVMAAVWGKGPDMTETSAILGFSQWAGLETAMAQQSIKDRLRAETEAAMKRGCWGSPHFFLNEDSLNEDSLNEDQRSEHFWGCDKRWQIQQWLERPW